ncbi:type I polyketide synthase [Teredinibacter turnerae]|uniref:type I polyketide synthase n=1 Tax=Teredinibacter turnerae TaxID=2426 RepID=UPI000379D90D|nr:type I polyketide synthase [Teredinibacter turnerae]
MSKPISEPGIKLMVEKSKPALSPLKQALVAIGDLQKKLAKAEAKKHEPVAIVGMACRLPGQVETPADFWQFLERGGDGINHNPVDRWPVHELVDTAPAAPGKTVTLSAGLIEDYDKIDAGYFGLAPREVETMDPQQRLALELSWSAIQDAGYSAAQMMESNTGVYLGVGAAEYFRLCLESGNQDAGFFVTGNTQNVISGRVAYLLGIHGPTVAIDTACSSSLVAIHHAVQALRRGECEAALAGGVNLLVDPQVFVSLSKAGMLSTDGQCKTFDKNANGYVRGEGGGVLLLKTLTKASADGDRIHAVIRGSAVNQDGRSSSLTAPNGPAQQMVIKKALEDAEVKPVEVNYIETHGTGTPLGDPIEVGALTAVYGQQRNAPLVLGALKSNIGHLEAASGVASIIKAVLSLQHGRVPTNLHFNTLNPHIELDTAGVTIAREPTLLASADAGALLKAGVSSFGFSGTNAHIILEQAPCDAVEPIDDACEAVLTLSAKSEKALSSLAQSYADFVQEHSPRLRDFCASVNAGRDHYGFRKAFIAKSGDELLAKLQAVAKGETAAISLTKETLSNPPRIGFMFTGQGAQFAGMAHDLYQNEPVFKAVLDECAKILSQWLEYPLLSVLWGDNSNLINETSYTQPALFSVEYSLAQLWSAWGVQPTVVMGHSVGEYVAACVAGIFSLEEGLWLIAQRGQLIQSLPAGGGMLVVLTDSESVASYIKGQEDRLSIAAINAPQQTVVSGALDALETLKQVLNENGVRSIALAVSHAFHSPLMHPIVESFRQVASEVAFKHPELTVISNLTGAEADERIASANYWAEHIAAPVRFADGVQEICQHVDVVLEIGPKTTLIGLARQCVDDYAGKWLVSLHERIKDTTALNRALVELYECGAVIDWRAVHASAPWHKLSAPLYPYQRQRYWVTGADTKPALPYQPTAVPQAKVNALLGQRLALPLMKETCYQSVLSAHSPAYLEHHRLFGIVIVPGASHVSMVLTAVRDRFDMQDCVLSDVVFYQPIAIADGAEKPVQLLLTPQADGQYEFKIISLNRDDDPYRESGWTVHATGNFVLGGEQHSELPVDRDTATSSWPLQETGEDFYQRIWEGGYTLGSAFQWVGDRWAQAGETLHRMVLPELPDGALDYQIHPGLLDSCFQAFGSSAGLQVEEDDIYIPFSVGRMRFYQQPAAGGLWCYSRPRSEQGPGTSQRYLGDLTLFDDQGRLVFEIEGLELRKSSQALLKKGLLDVQDDSRAGGHFYQAHWELAQDEATQAKTDGQWLVVTAPNQEETALYEVLEAAGKPFVTVSSAQAYAKLAEGRYTLRSDSVDDYLQLLQAFEGQTIAGILDLRVYAIAFDPVTDSRSLQEQVLHTCAGELALLKALSRHFSEAFPRLVVATRGAQALAQDDINVAQHAVWALGRVMALELPHIASVFVDLPDTGNAIAMTSENAARLVGELDITARDNQRLLRGAQRYVQRLGRAERQEAPVENLVTADKSYLITGAMGGLGRQVTEWLVAQGARHLALLVRREPDEEVLHQLHTLSQTSGADIRLLRADIADQAQVFAAVAEVESSMPALGGVMHLAGVVEDQAIDQATVGAFAKVLSPKVAGGWNLHLATREQPLDFFVSYSSIASLFGTPGQVNYAVGNSFLDGLMQHRQASGLAGLSINWGPWGEVGMAARLAADTGNKMAAAGLRTFDVAEGMEAMCALMQQPPVSNGMSVGAVKVDWPVFLQKFPGAATAPLFHAYRQEHLGDKHTRGGMLAQLQAVPVGERRELLISQVVSILVDILRLPSTEKVSLDQGFFDSGMDSLMSLEFRQRLEREFDITLAPTVAFNYPTVGELIGYLCSEVLELSFDESDDEAVEEEHDELALADDLSEDDLAALLEQQLAT